MLVAAFDTEMLLSRQHICGQWAKLKTPIQLSYIDSSKYSSYTEEHSISLFVFTPTAM